MSDAKILIVEDEGIEALDLQHRLTSLGYPAPDIAFSGEEAISKAEEMQPDLVLMDIMLHGGIDGVTAAGQVHDRFDIPIVYLTAYADEDTLQRAKITAPYGYIVKPFKERELYITIDVALYKHKMEKRLKENEKWLATTLRSIGDAVIATDKDGLVTFMNPIAEELTGWKLEEAVGRTSRVLVERVMSYEGATIAPRGRSLTEIFRIINRDTRQPVENPVTRVLSEGVTVGLANHTVLIARNGTELPIDDSAAPIKDDRGNMIGVILVFRDITEREKAERALRKAHDELELRVQERTRELRESNASLEAEILERKRAELGVQAERQRLYDVLETLPAYVILLTPDYHVPFANHVFRERFGESNGRRCFEFLFNRTEPCELCETYSVLKTMQPHRWEWTGPDTRNYEIHDYPFSGRDGTDLILEMGIDITGRKKAEEALQRAHDELEQRVKERTGELEEANKELEGFAYSVSHDLRAPLRAIDGFSEMILKECGDSFDVETRRKFDVVRANAKKMGRLIDDLLAFSRAGRAAMNFSRIDMKGLVREILEDEKIANREQDSHVQLADLPPAYGDRSLVRQVLANLIENAIKFTRNKPDPYIEVCSYEDCSEYIYYVRDNGVGFDMKYYDKLFGVFQRLVTDRQFEGTGVGLAIVHRLVNRHGGRVWAEGKPGEGATFYFTLARETNA